MEKNRYKLFSKYRKEIKKSKDLTPIQGDYVFKHFELITDSIISTDKKILSEIEQKQMSVNDFYKKNTFKYYLIITIIFALILIAFLIWGIFIFSV